MKSTMQSTNSQSKTISSIVSLFKRSSSKQSSGNPSPSPFGRIGAESLHPSKRSVASASSITSHLDLGLSFDCTEESTYAAPPPSYSERSLGAPGLEEDLEVVEEKQELSKEEKKRQMRATKMREEDQRMSEALKGIGF